MKINLHRICRIAIDVDRDDLAERVKLLMQEDRRVSNVEAEKAAEEYTEPLAKAFERSGPRPTERQVEREFQRELERQDPIAPDVKDSEIRTLVDDIKEVESKPPGPGRDIGKMDLSIGR